MRGRLKLLSKLLYLVQKLLESEFVKKSSKALKKRVNFKREKSN